MSFVERMQALSERFAQSEKMTDATIVRKQGGSINRATGKRENGSEQSIECRAVAALKTIRTQNGAQREATRITANAELKEGDRIVIGQSDYTIGEVSAVEPHGTAFLWKAIAQ